MKIERLSGFNDRIFKKKAPAPHGLAGIPTPCFTDYYYPLHFF